MALATNEAVTVTHCNDTIPSGLALRRFCIDGYYNVLFDDLTDLGAQINPLSDTNDHLYLTYGLRVANCNAFRYSRPELYLSELVVGRPLCGEPYPTQPKDII